MTEACKQEDVQRAGHRENTQRSDTSSLTASLEAMLLSCAIDAKAGRYLAVTDITGDITTCQFGAGHSHAIRGHNRGTNHQIGTEAVQEIYMEK